MPLFADHLAHVQRLADAAIAAAHPARLVTRYLAVTAGGVQIAGHDYAPTRLRLVSVGKASSAMARAAAAILGERLTAGVVIGKADSAELPLPLHYYAGDHPVPGPRSLAATRAATQLLTGAQPDDLALCLISGGTSALLTDPRLPLDQWQALTRALLHSGCTVQELNIIRQQFDRVKGGGLARLAAPATVVTLILSDVIGNDFSLIGSGPTIATPPDPARARAILDAYRVWEQLDAPTQQAARDVLAASSSPGAPETTRSAHTIIGDVGLAARAAAEAATELGFSAEIVTTILSGEASQVGSMAAGIVRSLPPNRCLIYGGETTVTVRGNGYGGRNQELALAAVNALDGAPGCVVAAFSTDGDDGVHPLGSPAVAGAFATGATAAQARARRLDPAAYLARSDSYGFFQALGAGHLTASAGTNVNDLLLLLTYYQHAPPI